MRADHPGAVARIDRMHVRVSRVASAARSTPRTRIAALHESHCRARLAAAAVSRHDDGGHGAMRSFAHPTRLRVIPTVRARPRPAPRAAARIVAAGADGRRSALRAHFRRKLLQRGDAVLGRRVRREQIVHALPRQRVDDEHVRGRRIALGFRVRDLMRGVVDLRQRGREPHRLAADARAEIVGGVFAGAADRHLHQHGAERRQDHHGDRADDAGAVVVVAVAAEEHAELRQHRDRAGDRRGDGHQQRVVIFDVRELVRDHAGELLAAERLHQARGHGDRGVLRIAAGGERVGLRLVHHEHARHRQAGAAGQLGHEMDEIGRAVAVDLMGAVHRQHHAVRIPVGEQVGRGGDHERDHGAAGAADQIADAHEEAGETGQQNGSLQIAHCRLPAARGRTPGLASQRYEFPRWRFKMPGCVEAPRLPAETTLPGRITET